MNCSPCVKPSEPLPSVQKSSARFPNKAELFSVISVSPLEDGFRFLIFQRCRCRIRSAQSMPNLRLGLLAFLRHLLPGHVHLKLGHQTCWGLNSMENSTPRFERTDSLNISVSRSHKECYRQAPEIHPHYL